MGGTTVLGKLQASVMTPVERGGSPPGDSSARGGQRQGSAQFKIPREQGSAALQNGGPMKGADSPVRPLTSHHCSGEPPLVTIRPMSRESGK
jgi:hypothetical protein